MEFIGENIKDNTLDVDTEAAGNQADVESTGGLMKVSKGQEIIEATQVEAEDAVSKLYFESENHIDRTKHQVQDLSSEVEVEVRAVEEQVIFKANCLRSRVFETELEEVFCKTITGGPENNEDNWACEFCMTEMGTQACRKEIEVAIVAVQKKGNAEGLVDEKVPMMQVGIEASYGLTDGTENIVDIDSSELHGHVDEKELGNEAAIMHSILLDNIVGQVDTKFICDTRKKLDGECNYLSVLGPGKPVEDAGSEVQLWVGTEHVGIDSFEQHVENKTKNQVTGEVTKVRPPPVKRLSTLAEITARTMDDEINGPNICVKARKAKERLPKLQQKDCDLVERVKDEALKDCADTVGPIPGVAIQNGVMGCSSDSIAVKPALIVLPRVSFQGSADLHDRDGKSAEDDLVSITEDETSESHGHISSESNDAGDSSSSQGQVSLKDEDLQVLVDQLLKVESESAEAQEMLEEESIASLREEVMAEFGEKISGLELDAAVEEEINIYMEQWEERYEDLQEQSSLLQEKLEDAGVNLPDIFKGIEKQAPEGCSTEAWRHRTHWAGHQPTQEVEYVVKRAEEELKIQRPTRSQHGKLVDEGASGFLERKLAAEFEDDGAASTSKCEAEDGDGWSNIDDFLYDEEIPQPGSLMGTKRWAAVYLASTPEQAVQLGLALPGVDTVEEIGDMESERRSQFKAAFANEKEQGLTVQQRKSIKKVRDEDDVKRSQRIRKQTWKRSFDQLHIKNPLQESQFQSAGMGDIWHLKKPVQHALAVSGNDQIKVIDKLTGAHASNKIELFSNAESIQLASRGGEGHVKAEDVNSAGVGMWQASSEDSTEFARFAIKGGSDILEHDVNLHAISKGAHTRLAHDVHVKMREDSLPENGGIDMALNRTDFINTLAEMPHTLVVTPMLELGDIKKKRVCEDESWHGDSDKTFTSKRCKSITIKDEVGISLAGQKEVPCVNSGFPKDAAQQNLSPSETILYRTTVVIDSDGEREVEEAVTEIVQIISPPSRSHLTRNSKYLGSVGQENGKGTGDVCQQLSETDSRGNAQKRNQKLSPKKKSLEFPCTACGLLLKKKDVLRHPKLAVGICKYCKRHYLSGPFRKDEDGSDSECSWCGEGGEVVCCDRCDKVFCLACITRNFREGETLRIVTSNYWLCYFCNPGPLSVFSQLLIQAELEAGIANDDRAGAGSCFQEILANMGQEPVRQFKKGRHRKNIRKVLDDDELEEKQKELLACEKERQERLEQWRMAAGTKIMANPVQRKTSLTDVSETFGEDSKDLINVVRAEDEAPVKIASSFTLILKEHQLKGVRFMWENCIVSEERIREGGESFGCILAHSMGLGKTLQVITFLHTVLSQNLGLSTALIVVPVNVLHNWRREFEIWQAEVTNPATVYMLEDSNRENSRRAALLTQWKEDGGVMLIGYSAFRNLCLGKHVKDKVTRDELCQALQNPGPDLLVCDEAHTIKNTKADITQVLKQVKTRRRIALTGSPLQNNLMEYYCMVDFVREGFLGSPQVFKNRFQNPIENGQHADSTQRDVRLMKQRAHVLNKQLRGFVQRMNMSVLKDELPPKCVYVISVRLSSLQRRLYTHYLQVHGLLQDENKVFEDKSQRRYLFHAYHALAKVWNHPDLLLLAEEGKARKQDDCFDDSMEDSDEEKLSDGDTGADCVLRKAKIPSSHRLLKKKSSTELDELEKPLWWKSMIPEDHAREDVEVSGKMVLLLRLLTMCSLRGDKALVFSQSLGTLGIIERFLEKRLLLECNSTYWERDKHWYRLDGSTPAASRMQMCERFNDPLNTTVRCVLISTRAGSLGINLPAANRVVIFDGSWNPTHDLQALFRAWRLGQTKPVYAYRLLAHGTMEEKIYSRQVAKEGVAARVLDEQQVGRLFAGDDLEFLFRLEDDGDGLAFEDSEKPLVVPVRVPGDQLNFGPSAASVGTVAMGSTSRSKLLAFTLPVDAPPRDDLMGNLLIDYRPRWVVSYHEHEPLLEHREEENLSSEEQKAAWESYKIEGLYGIQMLQNASTQAIKDANAVVPNPPSVIGSVRCSPKDHAAILYERNVAVGLQIICATCLLLVSWENLQGEEQLGFGQPGK